ncbi:hypothetical protein SK128_003655, partial [Halocaridina rubra]
PSLLSTFSSLLYPGMSRISTEYMEGLCSQLRESEASRWQLHDQCTRLERLVNVLRKKVNGLSTFESTARQEGTKVMLVDLTLHGANTEGHAGSGHQHPPTSTSSEGEPKDSLSSLESVETASASSWRRGDVANPSHSAHSTASIHSSNTPHISSSPCASNNSHSAHHASPASPQSNSDKANAISNHSGCSTSTSHKSQASLPHRHHGSNTLAENDHHNIPSVTIVGPITEL